MGEENFARRLSEPTVLGNITVDHTLSNLSWYSVTGSLFWISKTDHPAHIAFHFTHTMAASHRSQDLDFTERSQRWQSWPKTWDPVRLSSSSSGTDCEHRAPAGVWLVRHYLLPPVPPPRSPPTACPSLPPSRTFLPQPFRTGGGGDQHELVFKEGKDWNEWQLNSEGIFNWTRWWGFNIQEHLHNN